LSQRGRTDRIPLNPQPILPPRRVDLAPWKLITDFTKAAIVFHVLLFLYSLQVPVHVTSRGLSVASLNTTRRPSLFAIFMTDLNSSRVPDLLQYLSESAIPREMDFEYWVVNYTKTNITSLHSVYPPDEFRRLFRLNRRPKRLRKDLDLSSKFFFGLRFFLENSSAQWFYRATDDTIINFPNLLPFMRHIDARWNPLRQPVVIGSCIDARRFSYLQGGSGLVISRFAAAQMIGHRDSFVAALNKPEDVYFTKLLDALNVSLKKATSEFFIGHDIFSKHRGLIWNRTLHLLPRCPAIASIWRRKCRSFVAPLADLVFWHQEGYNRTLGPTIGFARMVFGLPRNILWWSKRGRPHLCRVDEPPPRLY
jgi:hypothetical protein